MVNSVASDERTAGSRAPNFLLKALGSLASAAALTGAMLYLAGNVSHRNELNDLGIPPGIFPQGIEATMVSGYYAVLLQWTSAAANVWLWTTVLIAIAIIATHNFCVRFCDARRTKQAISTEARGPDTHQRQSPWYVLALGDLMSTGVVFVAASYLLLVSTILVMLPAVAGEKHGQSNARTYMSCLETTQSASSERHAAVARDELYKGSQIIARGIVVTASPAHIAMYDYETASIRTMDRAGTDLRSRPAKRPTENYNPCWWIESPGTRKY